MADNPSDKYIVRTAIVNLPATKLYENLGFVKKDTIELVLEKKNRSGKFKDIRQYFVLSNR